MVQSQTTPDTAISHFLGLNVVVLRGFDSYAEAHDAREAILRSDDGLDARICLGVGVDPLFVLLVPVTEARRARRALAAGSDRAPVRPGRDARPAIADRRSAPDGPASPATAPGDLRSPTRRPSTMPPAQTTWEAKRRLLNVRCGQYVKLGQPCDRDGVLYTVGEVRHLVAWSASGHRTNSSRRLTDDQMDEALSLVEHKMHEAGVDVEALDAEYRQRVAKRAGTGPSLRLAERDGVPS